MELSRYLALISPRKLSQALRDAEDEQTKYVQGNPYTVQAAWRLLSWMLCRDQEMPEYKELPPRFRSKHPKSEYRRRERTPLDYSTYSDIRGRIIEVLRDVVMPPIEYVKEREFDDEDAERDRRATIYEQQFASMMDMFGEHVDEEVRMGSKARAVWCREQWPTRRSAKGHRRLRDGLFSYLYEDEKDLLICTRTRIRRFESLRDAARYASFRTGKNVTRNQVRDAIRNSSKLAGRDWGFCDSPAAQCDNHRAKAVKCVDLNLPFKTQGDAAAFAGVSQSCMHELLKESEEKHEPVVVGQGGLRFQYLDRAELAMIGNKGWADNIRPLFDARMMAGERQYAMAG